MQLRARRDPEHHRICPEMTIIAKEETRENLIFEQNSEVIEADGRRWSVPEVLVQSKRTSEMGFGGAVVVSMPRDDTEKTEGVGVLDGSFVGFEEFDGALAGARGVGVAFQETICLAEGEPRGCEVGSFVDGFVEDLDGVDVLILGDENRSSDEQFHRGDPNVIGNAVEDPFSF